MSAVSCSNAFWKKKKLNPEFIKELESTAKSDPFTKDEFGEYRFGTFLHGCAIVKVEMTDNLLSVAIHSQHPIGLPGKITLPNLVLSLKWLLLNGI